MQEMVGPNDAPRPEAGADMADATMGAEARAMTSETAAWCDEVAALLDHHGRQKATEELRARMSRPPKREATVVVAGEDKRGKSSVVNALLGHPGLSPVGVETVTAAPINFRHADALEAFVRYNAESEPRPASLEEAQSLATLQGNPLNEHNVREIEIGLPAPLLEGMVVVDTPGVGGLDSGHAALTLQSLRSADALLFVLEAGAQIRGPELRFLREAAARTSRVIFALTKVDLYRGWRQIADDNRAILSEQAPRFAAAPVVPVSNLLAIRALRLAEKGDDSSRELWDESGLGELDRVLRTLVSSDLHVLRSANLVQTALTQLAPVERAMSERIGALGSPEDAQAALVAERSKLRELNQEKAEWPQSLNVALRKLNLDRADHIQGGLAEIRRRYDERLKTLKRDEQAQLPGELVADLTAFAGETNQWTLDQLVNLVSGILGEVAGEVSVADTVEELAGELLTEQLAAVPVSGKLKATDRVTLISSYISGHSFIAMLAGGVGMAAVGPIALAVGGLVGTAFAFGRFKVMKQQAFAVQFRPWLADQISRVQLNMNNNFQRTQIEVEVAVRRLLKSAFSERERQVNESIAACQKLQEQRHGERERERLELTRELQALRQLRLGGRRLLQRAAG